MNFKIQKLEKIDYASSSFELNVIRNINEALGFKITHCEVKDYIFFKRYKIFSAKTVVPSMAEIIAEINKCTIWEHQLIPIHKFLQTHCMEYPPIQYQFMMECLFEKNLEIEDQIKLNRLFRF